MNYFLALIILLLGWGGYYEYGQMQNQNARDKAEFEATISAQMVQLQGENTKLTTANAELTKNLAAAQAKIASLTTPPPNSTAAAPSAVPLPPPPPSNDLGTITTSDGRKFEKCHLLKVKSTAITISCTSEITEVNFTVLPSELQSRFGFDPQKGPVLPEAQVESLEQLRLLSEQSAAPAR